MRAIVLIVLTACSSDTIVLATLPSDAPCMSNRDCAYNSYCDKSACNAGGTCTQATQCGDNYAPSCGCDHISYYNDCLRKSHGVAPLHPDLANQGSCTPGEALTCSNCGATALCARVESTPVCWVLPADLTTVY